MRVKVKKVIDGDTFEDSRHRFFRLAEVDAPEKKERGYNKSKEALQNMIGGIVFIFWILDGYFLSQERSYRDLYNHVRKLKEEEIDFSMDISEYQKYKKTLLFIQCFPQLF